MKKQLFIISGCNGAGKTTASFTLLPQLLNIKEYVNADEIAKGISPFNPESVSIEAARLMLKRIRALLAEERSFSIETTLSTRTYAKLVTDAQGRGYEVVLLFFWLSSPELAKLRVAERVKEGGHNVTDGVIERRYRMGLRNLFDIYLPLVDRWIILDNTNLLHEAIAGGGKGIPTHVLNRTIYNTILKDGKEQQAHR